MQILSNLRKPISKGTEDAGKRGVSGLQKTQVVDDIFNHKPTEKREGSARLHLSHASRALEEEVRSRLSDFLTSHPPLAEQLSQLTLPGEGEGGVTADSRLLVRKARAYMRWLQTEQPATDPVYSSIQAVGLDGELRDLATTIDAKHKALAQARQQHAPNYYYQVYPETYAFN